MLNVWGVGYRLVDPVTPDDPLTATAEPPRAAPLRPRRARGARMSAVLAVVAAALLALWLVERRRTALRAELVTRAAHELRGRWPPRTWRCGPWHARRGWAPRGRAGRRAAPARGRRGRRPRRGRARRDRGRPGGTVDVGALLEEQARAWRAMGAAHGCEVRLAPVAPGMTVRGDRLRLSQAVGNVVANAIEHGRGPVVLSARVLGDRVRVEVCDGGAGLPAPVADLAARARRGRGSRGRGLAIAAEIARRHGDGSPCALAHGARVALDLPRSGRAAGSGGRREPSPPRAVSSVSCRRCWRGWRFADVGGREAAVRRQLGPLVPVLVTRDRVPAGARLDAARLAVRRVPQRWAPDGGFADPGQVRGMQAAVDLPAGADLTAAAVDDGGDRVGAPVGPGQRVADVLAVGSPALVRPGARVDVLVTREGSGGGGHASLALEDVEVLAARPAPEARSSDGAARVSASLRVTVRQAVYLAAAQAFAREIRLLPRAAGDGRRGAAGLTVDEGLRGG